MPLEVKVKLLHSVKNVPSRIFSGAGFLKKSTGRMGAIIWVIFHLFRGSKKYGGQVGLPGGSVLRGPLRVHRYGKDPRKTPAPETRLTLRQG